MVIYERKYQQEVDHGDEEEVAKPKEDKEMQPCDQRTTPKIWESEHPIQQKIMLENQKYWQNKFLFANEYFDFVNEVTHFWDMKRVVPLQVYNRNDD